MSTHNIFFCEEIRKIFIWISFISGTVIKFLSPFDYCNLGSVNEWLIKREIRAIIVILMDKAHLFKDPYFFAVTLFLLPGQVTETSEDNYLLHGNNKTQKDNERHRSKRNPSSAKTISSR